MGLLQKIFGSYSDKEIKRIQPLVKQVEALADQYAAMSEEELRGMTALLKERLAGGASLDDILPDAFATCREASWRVLGMKHFSVQIIGGAVLHQGRIAEMRTGEGKTLVATLPAYLNALTGQGVHIVTVNDYLARRDSEWMGKLYRYLGLSVGLIVHGLQNDERRAAYECDITYGTNNEMGFDYLRDNMVLYKRDKVQRGFAYAIVDEVDSILIDEARTPLIISGKGDKSTQLYEQADLFAAGLKVTRVREMDNKEDNDVLTDGDYIVDEKARTATLTSSGVAKAERYFNIENLMDEANITLQHHINQAIKARGVMKRDVDYVVKDDSVIIVDESTGRLMMGRRYNEGLHQAIEAKEHVKVERESKTLATVTFQNYFRMYAKLAGMTGTAMTEEEEFREIYKLDVVEIPTNRPVNRKDLEDVVYKTMAAKFNAVIDEIITAHQKGQPVLVGTISIEKSELLSKLLSRRGVKHEVLNAKHHEKEAEIVAQAGQLGAVTIATNMAGRGTDIVLGGNAEYMAKNKMRKEQFTEELIVEADGHSITGDPDILAARARFEELYREYKVQIVDEAEQVKQAGGLYIIGTERHESRRIDNQLRGRSGRQGDSGTSRFYLSMEDDLMRLFGGERMQSLMDTLKIDDDMPIEAGMLTSQIESAQKRVEARNFGIRKSVLDFDDVMNRQRELIYGQRGKVLDGEDMSEYIASMIEQVVEDAVALYLIAEADDVADWNLPGLREYFRGWLISEEDPRFAQERLAATAREEIVAGLKEMARNKYTQREAEFGAPIMREMERIILLRNVDSKWMNHIDDMNELKRGIYLRSYGQKDPVVEYRIEGFDMFDDMICSIREDTVKSLYLFRLRTNEEIKREQVAKGITASHGGDTSEKKRPQRRETGKVGPNESCPCGSGKKYKKCCGMRG